MARRTIQSPGVEIRESDLSLRTPTQGTTTYITGYSHQGPTDEVVGVSNITEFEQIYGEPRSPAERYFYHSVKAALNSTASVLVNRLPYGGESGEGFGSLISVLAYPAMGVLSAAPTGSNPGDYATSYDDEGAWFLGAPKQFEMTKAQYASLRNGELFPTGWSDTPSTADDWTSIEALSSAAILIVNKGQTIVDGQFNGYYIGMADNVNINPARDFDSITDVRTVQMSAGDIGLTNFLSVPTSRLEFSLTASPEFGDNPANNSISQIMENRIVNYDISQSEYDDTLNIGVFKLRQSVFSKDAYGLDYLLEEGYNGSVGYYRQRNSENGGLPINFFIERGIETSRNIDILVNPALSDQIRGLQLNNDGTPKKKFRIVTDSLYDGLVDTTISTEKAGVGPDQLAVVSAAIGKADALFALGAYGEVNLTQKVVGSVPTKLDRALARIRNEEAFQIDIIPEAGLGTIWAYNETTNVPQQGFDDTQTTAAFEALRTSNEVLTNGARDAYMSIFNRFNTFVGPFKDGGRGDILYIADPIRQLLITGKDSKIEADSAKNFYTDVYWALRHQFELCNTSYACTYANYFKVFDSYTGLFVYVPPSGFAAAKMASTDAAVGPWGAPAGFTRGLITTAVDIAISPNQRQRDDMYNVNLNPVTTFQDRGNVIFGQKTLLKKPSAFDRINVRRTFLYLEKITKKTMQYFIFENNTLFTRSRILNTLSPFYERVKSSDGIFDYLIVCDERNNTPEVIDQNELVVDIYIKPVKTAEFILVNFFATRTDASFEEIAG